jgi:hypothetical protein
MRKDWPVNEHKWVISRERRGFWEKGLFVTVPVLGRHENRVRVTIRSRLPVSVRGRF